MCEFLTRFVNALMSVNWLEVVKGLAPLATAIIAGLALRNWQRQDKAKREAEFLDAMIEATHTYIAEMPKPITLLEMAKIGMDSHVSTWESGDDKDKAVKGAIAYIQKTGEADAKRLLDVLESIQPSTIRLRSLTAKGQVFGFHGYTKCQNAVAILTSHFDRIEAFATVIGSPTWNWEHPEILKLLVNAMEMNPEEMRGSIRDNNVIILEFSRNVYKQVYG